MGITQLRTLALLYITEKDDTIVSIAQWLVSVTEKEEIIYGVHSTVVSER